MSVDPSRVLAFIKVNFPLAPTPGELTRRERKIADSITRILKEAEEGELFVEEDEDLFIDDCDTDITWDPMEEKESLLVFNGNITSKEKAEEMLAYYRDTDKGSRTLPSMMRRFRGHIRSSYDLQKLREYEKTGAILSSRRVLFQRLVEILTQQVYEKFNAGISLHDADLRMMALRINKEHCMIDEFKASPRWIQGFKRKCAVSSRRITTFVSKKNYNNKCLEMEAKSFLDTVRTDMSNLPLSCFFNADQSGFVKEMHSQRSLAPTGSKKVERIIQSSAAISHSYTVLPLLCADGTLGDKLYVVLQETNGTFPRSGHITTHNLVVSAGRSHIMTKNHMLEFFKECVFTSASNQTLYLILDSWPAWKDHALIKSLAPPGVDVTIKNIPPGCTGLIQPEDRYFFRLFKGVVKRITAHVQANDEDFICHKRDNILRLLSVVYHQFKSPIFQDCWKYAWHVAGYTDRPPPFETPNQVLFGDVCGNCDTLGCVELAFVKCSRCKHLLCFKDFIPNPHIC